MELKCRKPNLLEIYDYIDAIGGFQEENSVKLKRKIIAALEPFVNWQEAGYESFNALVSDTDNRAHELIKLSDELYKEVLGVLSKKS